MKKGFTASSYVSFLGLVLLALSACGKKSSKTSSVADNGSASRVDGGTSVPPPSNNWPTDGGGTSIPDNTNTGGNTTQPLRQCSKIVSGVTEAALAGFFFKTVVPAAERAWSPEQLNSKYWVNGKLTGLMEIEGDVTLCLTISGSQASLRVEYEDHFATTWVTIASSYTYYLSQSSTDIHVIWADEAGFIELKGAKSAAVLRYANMPSTTALNARASADKTAAPLALYLNQRNQCRNGVSPYTLDYCVTNFVYPPDMFFDATQGYPNEGNFGTTQKQRLRDIIGRYVDSETLSTTTHPFNSNYNRYLIKNGKLGTVNLN